MAMLCKTLKAWLSKATNAGFYLAESEFSFTRKGAFNDGKVFKTTQNN